MSEETPDLSNVAQQPDVRNWWRRLTVSPSWEAARTVVPVVLISAAAIVVGLHFVRPAPSRTLTLASGPHGSTFESTAEKYQRILARNGITLKIIESAGSLDNLNRLSQPGSGVDLGLVQSGLTPPRADNDLVSLGSIFYEPLLIFYRNPKPLLRLSELHDSRIAIGPEGSGARALALALLKANEIEPQGRAQLLALEGQAATDALLHHEVDAIFLTGDSAAPGSIRELLHTDGIRLFDFSQADAYVRRFPYLSKLELPAGAFDLGENLPAAPISMLAPTVELVAHSNLHPALSDLLTEAAFEVHSRATLLQAAGQFPTPTVHGFPIDSEAARYYKTGSKSFAYRFLPFWLASLVTRAVVVLLPIFVVAIPGLRFLPQLYNWRINARIHRHYVELMALERESLGALTRERRAELLDRLVQIEKSVISGKVPGSHADQAYVLRQHIGFVRESLTRAPG